ncbi:protein of unknown function [Ruminococcaceae bacterium BL-4]|jgi:predicted acetyltransferase|nr:protein of unknown function [Ruminococcaceae bacterium BL-4]
MIRFADWSMLKDLIFLWQIAFQEEKRAAKFYFTNFFHPEECLVVVEEGKLVSMLQMLPGGISLRNDQKVSAQYVFACATLPEYRGRGLMKQLLSKAEQVGFERGDWYSVILPANEGLYHFYELSGYSTCFKVGKADFSYEELKKISDGFLPQNNLPDIPKLNEVRNHILREVPGSMLWNKQGFWRAVRFGEIYGSHLIAQKNAYALAYMENDDCQISELMSSQSDFPQLMASVLAKMPAKTYHLRMPIGPLSQLEIPFGMGKALKEKTLSEVEGGYLGLAMD